MKRTMMVGVAFLAMAGVASAAPLTLSGNFVRVGVSDTGTLGSNGGTPPGMLHDPTGTGNFAPGGIPNDYLTPGTPHESFAIFSDQTGFRVNDNTGSAAFATVSGPSVVVEPGFANAASWSGTIAGILDITNTYFFNANDERVNVRTTLTALSDITSLSFGRSEDPDPDVNAFGSFVTKNTRGNGTLGAADLVTSRGDVSGLFLGLLNKSGNTYDHNTGISGFCCSADNPVNVLPGYGALFPLLDIGDLGLQMAWSIGNLATGASATINYAYVFGDRIEDVVVDPGVPEPATLALLGVGLAGLAALRRKKT